MVDLVFLSTYKGALYPLPLDRRHASKAPSASSQDHHVPVQTLVDLCCDKVVLDATSTNRAIDTVPTDLCYSLMRSALLCGRDRAIEVLIARWPGRLLSLQKLAPLLFDDIRALYDTQYVKERMRRGVKYTTCLAHTFVECLKKRSPTRLKFLDLSGYPSAEVIVNYLSSHVLLVYNEKRQREIITMYNEVTRDLPDSQRHLFSIDSTIPNDCFIIGLDACIQTQEMELYRALNTSKLEQCLFKLRTTRLDLSCVGIARICVLLEQVDPRFLVGLCMKFNGIHNDVLPVLVQAMQPHSNITALDLDCNDLRVTSSDAATEQLSNMLAALPHLVRLDLSNNALRFKVRQLLSSVQKPLEYLRLCACRLSDADLSYLASSHHCRALREVDLSENHMATLYPYLESFLRAVRDTLVTLELEHCALDADTLTLFLVEIHCLRQLQYLNICRNGKLSCEFILAHLTHLVNSPVDALKMSYPGDCYLESDPEELFVFFQNRLLSIVQSKCLEAGRRILEIILDQRQ